VIPVCTSGFIGNRVVCRCTQLVPAFAASREETTMKCLGVGHRTPPCSLTVNSTRIMEIPMKKSHAQAAPASPVFSPITINGLTISNRIFKAPTMECMADSDGAPTDLYTNFFTRTARGGSGLMFTGLTYVNREGQAYLAQGGIHDDRLIRPWKKLTRAVHADGGRIVMQISHGGRQIDPRLLAGRKAAAASAFPNLMFLYRARRLNGNEIRKIIADFAEAAKRVREAGFDGVQIHASGGYLLAGFLSPLTNRRHDEWGGDRHRRFHMFEEIYAGVRSAVGADYPVFAKLHLGDLLVFGRPVPANYHAALWMQELGVDAIEFAVGTLETITITFARGGMPVDVVGSHLTPFMRGYWKTLEWCTKPLSSVRKPYFLHAARELKRRGLKVPLLLAGGIRRFEDAEQAVVDGIADMVGMSRPLIREPNLPRRWMEGSRDASTCVSCNRCTLGLVNATPLSCSYKKER
jgi:2,4-dienoyl-CoA reductase-like NADH-dependent reductase (Old Yellow Enzyme family)